jgi:DNA-binding HxlR family transcriptional regulator
VVHTPLPPLINIEDFSFKKQQFMPAGRCRVIPGCPIVATIDLIGGKWKIAILWLLKKRTRRFNELRRILSPVTHKVLVQQLRALEARNLIARKVYPEVPPKVEYSLTTQGKKLIPILYAMSDWGKEYSEVEHKPILPFFEQ